ncbi:MAG: Era-like GTP-binding protein, partial [Gammaproteobacteria bacterium]
MIWKRVLDALLPWRKNASPEAAAAGPDGHVDLARESLQSLLADPNLPVPVRSGLAAELAGVQAMLDKLEHGHIHIAVFGRVGVGKSALLNALLHESRFSTSPLHGETREPQSAAWQEWEDGGLFLIDTPGINDIDGEERERQAHAVAARADLILFVVDGDLSGTEMQALRVLIAAHRPVLLVFNKIDRYTDSDRALLLDHLKLRGAGLVPPDHIVCTAAEPAERIYLEADA